MKAIIDATGYRSEVAPLLYYKPSAMLCVGGKPIIIHVIEFLLQKHITHFDVVLNYLPEKIEKELGTGERWGVDIIYHLARESRYPFQAIRPFAHKLGGEAVLFALGDALPEVNLADLTDPADDAPVLFISSNGTWSGWGILPVPMLEGISPHLLEEDFLKSLKGKYKSISVKPFLSTHSLKDFQESNRRFLNIKHEHLVFPTTAKHVEPGVWISRGVSLHPTAKIIPPVFIGEYCQINHEAIIGPNAVIEDFCIIDNESDIVNSIVCKRSYVGESLNIQNSVVDRNLLLNLSLDTHVTICDDFILGESYPKTSFHWPFRLVERSVAALLFILFYPIQLLMFYDHHLRRDVMLRLPASNDPLLWETFLWETLELNAGREPSAFHRVFSRLPLLKSIVRGDIHFVGVIPRHPRDVEKLPSDWKKLYLKSKIGIITVSEIEERNDSDTCYASEALYATRQGFWYDLHLFYKWFVRKCKKIMDL